MDKIIANNDDLETEVVNDYNEERINATTLISGNLVKEIKEIHATNAIDETKKSIQTVILMKKENNCDCRCRCCLQYDQLKYYIIDFLKCFMEHDIMKFREIGQFFINLEEEEEKPENLSNKQ